jgi:metal-responsive CopG/Arc/MetJ family transcriptional regulator
MLTFRAPAEIGEALDRASAELEGKPSRSELIRGLVVDWLKRSGYLAKSK